MNVTKTYTTLCDFELGKPDIKAQINLPFYRVGYFLHLQSAAFGNQWIYTEFDTWTQDTSLLGVPIANGSYIQRSVNNLDIRDSNGRNETSLADCHIEFSAYNYAPGANYYDTTDDLQSWMYDGNYGCMQVHCGTNVLWAFNCHNNIGGHDIGIGNNTTNEHKDWTFTFNSSQYTVKHMRIVLVSLDISFNENQHMCNVNMRGVIHGDSLIWNKHSESWGQTLVPYKNQGAVNEPNFIIALTGQSNSQGANAWYDSNVSEDQPHERIFGFNPTTQTWEIADLNTESLGAFWHKAQGWQSLAFHSARRFVEAYPDIRIGIINLGVGGQPICRWAKFNQNEHWYSLNTARASNVGVLQGDIYDLHVTQINAGLSKLSSHKTIDAIFWHQGESDWDTEATYYHDCIQKVIDQYRSLDCCNKDTPFVVAETTGGDYFADQGWERRNIELRNINIDADPFTRCVHTSDLTTSDDQYNNGDRIHFSANAQRSMGTRYFKALRSMYSEKM